MAGGSSQLLAWKNPLRERLGADFFGSLPQAPGIYRMLDESGTVLYVGKSKNLRARLNSYRHAAPGRAPRKLLRLLYHVRRVDIQTTPDEARALVLENQLLRTLKPLYNRQNTRPESYLFLGLKFAEIGETFEVRFRLTARPRREQGDILYGVFRSRRIVKESMAALLRLFWLISNRDERFAVPSRLLSHQCPRVYALPIPKEFKKPLEHFWEGESPLLLEEIALRLLDTSEAPDMPPFLYRSVQTDIDFLREAFEKGPAANRRMKERFGFKKRLIPQELVDDWLALYRNSCEPAASTT